MKIIEGFSNYAVSYSGEVFSLRSQRFLKSSDNGEGYLRVSIPDDNGVYKTQLIHRLVAGAYIPNPDNKLTVNHRDCNKLNNHCSNLEWATYLENDQHARGNFLRDDAASRSLSDDQAFLLFRLILDGQRKKEICEMFNITTDQYRWYVYGDTYRDIREEFDWSKRPNKKDTLSQEKVISVCKLLQDGKTPKEISQLLHIPSAKVYAIKRRQSFRFLSESFIF